MSILPPPRQKLNSSIPPHSLPQCELDLDICFQKIGCRRWVGGKLLYSEWRNLTNTTLARWLRLIALGISHIDSMFLLIWCGEEGTSPLTFFQKMYNLSIKKNNNNENNSCHLMYIHSVPGTVPSTLLILLSLSTNTWCYHDYYYRKLRLISVTCFNG